MQFGYGRYILTKLSTMYLQKVRRPDGAAESELTLPSAFLRSGNLNKVQIWRVGGSNTYFGITPLWLTMIRELTLFCSFSADDILGICRSAINLENLTLVMTEPRFLIYNRPPPPPGEDINRALALRAETLKSFEFRITGKRWFQNQIGHFGVLECLPGLTKLEKLRTETSLIYKSNDISLTPAELWSKLPPNIIELDLIEWPTYPPNLDNRLRLARTLYDCIFIALAKKSDAVLSELRQIHFLHSPYNPCFDGEQLDSIKKFFDDCKNPIEFSWTIDLLQLQPRILGHLTFTLPT